MTPQNPDEHAEPTKQPNSEEGSYELDPVPSENAPETPKSAEIPNDRSETSDDSTGSTHEIDETDERDETEEIGIVAADDPVPTPLACPVCGEPMPGSDQVVCLACGYDLVSNTRLGKTKTKEKSKHGGGRFAIVDSEEGASEEVEGAIMPRSNHRLWSIITAAAALVMMFALIAGWSSLFPSEDGHFRNSDGKFTLDAPLIKVRLLAVIQFLVASAVVIGCGMIALRLAAWLENRPFGSVIGVLSRVAAVVAVAALARLIPIDSGLIQTMTHLLVGVGVVVGGSMLILKLRDRIALIHLAAWGLLLLIVVPAARLVAWSMPF
ncbi:MAG: hypothetical protein OSA40_04300 [Phycisphaerales bacterium]|nr:hypothetical protein [Phycisphaerales bacterium]